MKKWLSVAGLAALLGVGASLPATQRAPERLGIILLHGKLGTPSDRKAGLAAIARDLNAAGYLTAVPSMPWNDEGWEHIALDVPSALALIDNVAADLRMKGAHRIVIGGHSQGANVALAYAVARGSVAGVVMAAPGHRPENLARKDPAMMLAIAGARTMVAGGRGANSFDGPDGIQGSNLTLRTTAMVYLSWMDPLGMAAMEVQAPRLPPSIPLLMVISPRDPFFREAFSHVYRPAAKHPYSRYLPVGGDHSTTPMIASTLIRNWIGGLPR
jgi:pimeloyl-ACP methyl ester carboxylesterase